jgi:hypothetical protein
MILNREDFKDYCLRALGSPVLEINVADEQVEDRIDEAFEKFFDFHPSGSTKEYLMHKITKQELSGKYIYLPDNVHDVLKVHYYTINSNNFRYLSKLDFITAFSTSKFLSNYVVVESYLNLLESILNPDLSIRFNKYTNKLFLDTDWSIFQLDDILLVDCYMTLDVEENNRVFNDRWLKHYAIALIKRQWGQNLLKYDNFQLPSGMVMNGRQIYDDAIADIEKLEQELYDVESAPPDFFMG